MGMVVVDRKGSKLSLDGRRLRMQPPDGKAHFIPLAHIGRLVVTATVQIESNLLGALAKEGACTLLLSPRDLQRTAIIMPPHGKDHAFRLQQYRVLGEQSRVCAIARKVLRLKLMGQLRTLRRLPQAGVNTRQALRAWPALLHEMKEAETLHAMRGLEGGAAAMYFQALTEAVPEALNFSGRNRRPPRDPVNAALSLSYTLLHFEAVRALLTAGFDPTLGVLHRVEYSRESLACDCVEPLRPLVDRFVLDLFHQRILRAEHFGMQKGSCLLSKTGREHFYPAWARFVDVPVRHMRRGMRLLKHFIREQAG